MSRISRRRRAARGPASRAGGRPASKRGHRPGKRTDRRGRLYPFLVASGATVIALAVAIPALIAAGQWGSATSPLVAEHSLAAERLPPGAPASGRVLVPFNGGLQLANLPGGNLEDVVPARRSAAVTGARWSPEGHSAAYAVEYVRPSESTISSEIHIARPGREPQVAVAHSGPGSAVELPSWTPDGGSLYFGASALEGQLLVRRVERLDLAAGTRTPVVEGMLPDLSADGSRIAFIRPGLDGDTLLVSRADGQRASVLIPPDISRFGTLGAPRFSPDGRTVALPIRLPPTLQVPPPRPAGFLDLIGVSTALAHGDPWDLFLVDANGGEPRRLTQLFEDEMGVAWSPDGAALAIYSIRGLQIVDLHGNVTPMLSRGGYGAIDWSR